MDGKRKGVRTVRAHAGSAAAGKPQMRAVRHDGWTEKRRQTFCDELAETCNVTMAADVAGMSAKSARELKKRDSGFARAWEEAMYAGYEKLELVMLERAIHGTAGPTVKTDAGDEKIRRYNDAVGLRLLQAHRETAMKMRRRETGRRDAAEIFAEIKRRFAEIKARKAAHDGCDNDG